MTREAPLPGCLRGDVALPDHRGALQPGAASACALQVPKIKGQRSYFAPETVENLDWPVQRESNFISKRFEDESGTEPLMQLMETGVRRG